MVGVFISLIMAITLDPIKFTISQYERNPGNRVHRCTKHAVSSPAVTETSASTYCAHGRMARL